MNIKQTAQLKKGDHVRYIRENVPEGYFVNYCEQAGLKLWEIYTVSRIDLCGALSCISVEEDNRHPLKRLGAKHLLPIYHFEPVSGL